MSRSLPLLPVLALLFFSPSALAADDTEAPILEAWAFEQDEYDPGDQVTIHGHARDKSGLDGVLGHIWGPDEAFPVWVHEENCSVDQAGPFTCTITLTAQAPAGTYRLERWSLRDTVGHTRQEYHSDLSGRAGFDLSFVVRGTHSDLEAPKLHGIQVQTPVIQAGEFAEVHIQASDETGIRHASIQLTSDGRAPGVWGDCDVMDADASPQEFTCSLPTWAETPSGAYRVQDVALRDLNNVERIYRTEQDFTDGADYILNLTVENGSNDLEPPIIDSILATPVVPRGGTWLVTVHAHDNQAVQQLQIDLQTLQGNAYLASHICPLKSAQEVQAHCAGTIPENYPLGPVKILFVAASDPTGNSQTWSTWVGNSVDYEPGPLMHDRFYIGPRNISLPGIPVDALDAYNLEAPPGSVLSFALRLTGTATDLSFWLTNDAGDRLGVQNCHTEHDLDAVGIRCKLIVPPTATGTYTLTAVAADNTTVQVAQGLRTVEIRAGAIAPETLPGDWRNHTKAGVTLASFNGGTRAPIPATPWNDATDNPTHANDANGTGSRNTVTSGGTTQPAPSQNIPAATAPWALVALAMTFLAAMRRR